MILLIDNYDSFSYNLYQMIGEIEPDVKVVRNDEISVDEIRRLKPERIILSPGPGRPEDAGILIEVVKELGKEIPILGVCLGHQAVCAAFGAKITYAKKQMHGKQSQIKVDTETLLFSGCSQSILAARYHSLAVDEKTLPDVFEILARTEDGEIMAIPDSLYVTASTKDGEIMAIQHKEYPIYSVQFHPESIMTPEGRQILRNFIQGGIRYDQRSDRKNCK